MNDHCHPYKITLRNTLNGWHVQLQRPNAESELLWEHIANSYLIKLPEHYSCYQNDYQCAIKQLQKIKRLNELE